MEERRQPRGIDVSLAVPSSTWRAAPWGALGVSLVAHLTLMGIGSAIVFSPKASESNAPSIVAIVDPVVADPEPVLLKMGAWEPASGHSSGGGGNPNPAALAVSNAPVEPTPGGLSGGYSIAFGDGTDLSYTDVIGDGGTGGGSGGGNGAGIGPGNGDGFFGLDLAGERFVFVVDASRSMNHPYPGEAKNRLGRVKIELYHTIQKMKTNQSFFVVFFNTDPIPMPARDMVRAEPAILRPYMEWIFKTRAMGQTNPEPALLAALQLRPDKIYFLTDGDFSHRSVRTVREANRGRIPIHTIGFGGQGGEKNLQEIAQDSQGTYQFIPEPPAEAPAEKTAAASVAAP